MADDDNSLALGDVSSGQDSEQADSSGDSGNGADDRGQESGGAGGNPAKTNPSTDNSTSDDEDSDPVFQALMSGKMDDIGDDGEPVAKKKPATKAEKEEVPEPEKPETTETAGEADETADTEETAEKAKVEKPELSDEDKAELDKAPKQYRKEFTKLFEERHQLRDEVKRTKAQVEELTPVKQFAERFIKHASEAGLVDIAEDGTINAQALKDYIDQEKLLKGRSQKEVAAYYRDLANDLDPDSVPVAMPTDLKDLVDLGTLKESEALKLARLREAEAKKPEMDQRRQREEAARKEQQTREVATREAHKAKQVAYGEVHEVAKTYHARFGAEWDVIQKTVEAELDPLLADTNPKAWAKLAKTVIEKVIAGRKVPLKTPTKTPAPGQKANKIASDVMSDEEENEALATGKPLH